MMRYSRKKWTVLISLIPALYGVAAFGAVTNLWTGTSDTDWFNPDNWSESAVPGAAGHARVPAGTPNAPVLTDATAALASFTLDHEAVLTVEGWDSAIEAVTLTIAGTITHDDHSHITEPDNGEWSVAHRILILGSNITITADGELDGDYKGYGGAAGPGTASGPRSGAGHGGLGGIGYDSVSAPGTEYGNPAEPFQPGSGGGNITHSGGAGGVIRIAAQGHLQIDGILSVSGQNATDAAAGGSSGGSIWLNCRTFGGEGLLRADGGNGGARGGAGAGGRIALHYDHLPQEALPQSSSALRYQASHGTPGSLVHSAHPVEMGTLYLHDTYLMIESLPAERFWDVRLVIPGFTEWAPSSLTLDRCVFGLPVGFELSVQQDLVLSNSAALHVFAAPVDDPMTEDGALVDVGGDLLLSDNAWIFPYADPTNGATVAFNVAGDLSVAEDCGFDADNFGYRWEHGPGQEKAFFENFGPGIATGNRAGAGYGGRGGAGEGEEGGDCYGEAHAPRLPGSGSPRIYGGSGGGAIRITVAGHVEMNGLMTARSARPFYRLSAGPGSGGAIWLTCNTISGSADGLFDAGGGAACSFRAGVGGGGRIAVHYDTEAQAQLDTPGFRFAAPSGAISGDDRLPRWGAGTAGTLYLPDTQWLEPMAEAGQFLDVRLEIPELTHWTPAALTVGGGEFALQPGLRVEIAGNLTLQSGTRLHLVAAPTNSSGEAYGAFLDVGGDLIIEPDAWLYPHADMTNGAVVGIRAAGNILIEAEGGIDANAKGFMAMGENQSGPGAGQDTSSGGGYGGEGGGDAGGTVYGSDAWPSEPGSPGGWYTAASQIRAGQGGGAILLSAGDTIHMDGQLRANAEVLPDRVTATAGSGGGIRVIARTITGSGTIEAQGAAGGGAGMAGGGGGRVILIFGHVEDIDARPDAGTITTDPPKQLEFTGTPTADGGIGGDGAENGEEGTVRYRFRPPPEGTIFTFY